MGIAEVDGTAKTTFDAAASLTTGGFPVMDADSSLAVEELHARSVSTGQGTEATNVVSSVAHDGDHGDIATRRVHGDGQLIGRAIWRLGDRLVVKPGAHQGRCWQPAARVGRAPRSGRRRARASARVLMSPLKHSAHAMRGRCRSVRTRSAMRWRDRWRRDPHDPPEGRPVMLLVLRATTGTMAAGHGRAATAPRSRWTSTCASTPKRQACDDPLGERPHHGHRGRPARGAATPNSRVRSALFAAGLHQPLPRRR